MFGSGFRKFMVLASLCLLVVFAGYPPRPKPEPDYNWRAFEGARISVMLNQHPYSAAIVRKLQDFESLTGIKVNYIITPEDYYIDKLDLALNDRRGTPDVFMTGTYYIWEHAPKRLMQSLDEMLADPAMLIPGYDAEDFQPKALDSMKWSLTPGDPVGTGYQWAVPIGFELNSLAYNKRIFGQYGLEPPLTLPDLVNRCETLSGSGIDGLSVRISDKWTSLSTSFITAFTNFGAKDFVVENGKLRSAVNSDEAVRATELWVKLVRKCTSSSSWQQNPWNEAGASLGAGKVAMLFDADINSYIQNVEGYSKEAGNIAWSPAPLSNPDDPAASTNLWAWGLGMNNASNNKKAAWLFMQYFSSKEFIRWAAINANVVHPARKSVMADKEYLKLVGRADGFVRTLNAQLENASVMFTPQPVFFAATNEWARTLKRIVNGEYRTAREGLDELKPKIDRMLDEAG
ncbi:MAG TPA: extracellular solute-binding protein [Paenibacillus sp.]|uniref:ABC transporter substrate-binding protein n=1 Tax=Paenibacillus sp. TaxID=58172 RepID=UPI0028D90422|nr:extracellular solute-binding protein [Paenibacillus sp.]HUC91887.1 extracellular solute-binding protein [Paenibacillus sp.]